MFLRKWATVTALVVVATVSAGSALAQTNCSDLKGPIYVAGSTAIQPLVAGMAQALASSMTPANTIVYFGSGSCVGANAILMDMPAMPCSMGGVCPTGNALYWDNTTTAKTPKMCALAAMVGTHADVGVSDVFAKTCASAAATPAGFEDWNGPIQPMTFAVPVASSQQSLTAEEGYFVFGGFPMYGMVPPFTAADEVFVRTPTSGTQIILASSIGVPPGKIKGTKMEGGGGAVVADLQMAPTAESAIGFVGAATVDANRATLKALAFRAFKQWFAYYPDSSPTAFDKANVRDGHYVAWGYEHFITRVDNGGKQVSPAAQIFLDWVKGVKPGPWGADIADLASAANFVPVCAMHVQRSGEGKGAEMSYYEDPAPCDCAFGYAATKAVPAGCNACSTDADCKVAASPKCRHGYCEKR